MERVCTEFIKPKLQKQTVLVDLNTFADTAPSPSGLARTNGLIIIDFKALAASFLSPKVPFHLPE
jgi:hypothetical protein